MLRALPQCHVSSDSPRQRYCMGVEWQGGWNCDMCVKCNPWDVVRYLDSLLPPSSEWRGAGWGLRMDWRRRYYFSQNVELKAFIIQSLCEKSCFSPNTFKIQLTVGAFSDFIHMCIIQMPVKTITHCDQPCFTLCPQCIQSYMETICCGWQTGGFNSFFMQHPEPEQNHLMSFSAADGAVDVPTWLLSVSQLLLMR